MRCGKLRPDIAASRFWSNLLLVMGWVTCFATIYFACGLTFDDAVAGIGMAYYRLSTIFCAAGSILAFIAGLVLAKRYKLKLTIL